MKMILAIVNNDDSGTVSIALTRAGYSATKLSTTGGFLAAGNTTFLVGVEQEQVQDVIAIIRKNSRKRSQMVPASFGGTEGKDSSQPTEVAVGGATVFVLDVERFEKI